MATLKKMQLKQLSILLIKSSVFAHADYRHPRSR